MRNKYAMFVQIFVKHVLRNVNDTLVWTIVKNAHMHVEDVLKNVVKCERRIESPITTFCVLDCSSNYHYIYSQDTNYSTFTLSSYCPDQNFENKSIQDSVIFVVFLIYSAYILLHALTYSDHESIHKVNRSFSLFASDIFSP